MTKLHHNPAGRVCLIGAGPGDPGLITIKGMDRLRRAQVVVYDALVDRSLLDLAPTDAARFDVGKRAADHKMSQDQINELLAQQAAKGLFVVRLKGGDPLLFGRGAEEAEYLSHKGIECEVIPGVTAGIAAPAAAGIPVTHRDFASTVTFVTGHEDPNKDETAIDYPALARLVTAGGTLCFYMGVGRLAAISESLQLSGLPAPTPVAIVQWGTTARQRSLRSTLERVAADVAAVGLGAPAIIVVGPVAGMNAVGLDHFTRRPLFGSRVMVTRTRHQASDLSKKLAELGAMVIEAPTIELVPPSDWTAVDEAVKQIKQHHWLVLTSVNGVEALAQRMIAVGADSRHLAGLRIAAIGDATAEAIQNQLRILPDLVPTRFVAESLAAELIAKEDVTGKKILLLRADIARPALPNLLQDAGAIVTELAIYQTRVPQTLSPEAVTSLRNHQIDWVTFTSSSTATNLVEMLGKERGLLDRIKIASIGPITTGTLRELGLPPTIEAGTSNIDGLVRAMVQACSKK